MTKKTVNKSKVGKSENMKATQEDVVRMYGDSMVCEPCCEPDEACCCDDAALRGLLARRVWCVLVGDRHGRARSTTGNG